MAPWSLWTFQQEPSGLCARLSSASRTSPCGRPTQQTTALRSSDGQRGEVAVWKAPPHTPACEGTEHKLGALLTAPVRTALQSSPVHLPSLFWEDILTFPHFCSSLGSFSLRSDGLRLRWNKNLEDLPPLSHPELKPGGFLRS